MLRKMARSGRQTPFGLAEALMAVTHVVSVSREGRKAQNSLQFGSIRGTPVKEPLASRSGDLSVDLSNP